MNDVRRKQLRELRKQIKALRPQIEAIRADELKYLESLPDDCASKIYNPSEIACDYLAGAMQALDGFVEAVNVAVGDWQYK